MVYACVLYRPWIADTRADRISAVTCVNQALQPQAIGGVVGRIVDVTRGPAYTRRSPIGAKQVPKLSGARFNVNGGNICEL